MSVLAEDLTIDCARHSSSARTKAFLRVLVPIVAFPIFATLALPLYSFPQRCLAWVVFAVGSAPALRYFAEPVGVPLIELVGLQYVLFFSLPVFYESQLKLAGGDLLVPASPAVTTALFAAALAVIYLLVGYALARRLLRFRFPWAQFSPDRNRLLAYGLFLTGVSFVVPYLPGLEDSSAQGPMEVLLPRTLGLAILACVYYGGSATRKQRIIIAAIFLVSTVLGLVRGMSQGAIEPLLIWGIARWVLAKKAPIVGAAFVAVLFLILQPIKGTYRGLMGSGLREFSMTDALQVYSNLGVAFWSHAGASPEDAAVEVRESAAQRLSMVLSTAHYVELTPTLIPYTSGRTLLYPVISLVPRFLWPNKPTAQEVNKTLPVEYGIQSPINLGTTMFGVGHVAEVFTAFGLAGIMPIFLLLGVLYALPYMLLGQSNNLATTAMLIWLAINMMYIGSSVGTVLGGIMQQIIIQVIMLRLFTATRVRPALASAASFRPAEA